MVKDLLYIFQVLHNEMIQEIDHPTVGKIRIPGEVDLNVLSKCPTLFVNIFILNYCLFSRFGHIFHASS